MRDSFQTALREVASEEFYQNRVEGSVTAAVSGKGCPPTSKTESQANLRAKPLGPLPSFKDTGLLEFVFRTVAIRTADFPFVPMDIVTVPGLRPTPRRQTRSVDANRASKRTTQIIAWYRLLARGIACGLIVSDPELPLKWPSGQAEALLQDLALACYYGRVIERVVLRLKIPRKSRSPAEIIAPA